MKKLLILLLFATACKKDDGSNNPTNILGSWRFTGNNIAVGENLGDTLRFVKPDTIYYTFQGSTTWSNYQVQGSHLILIGSAVNDTLTIRSLNATQLQLVLSSPALSDTVNYQKFAP